MITRPGFRQGTGRQVIWASRHSRRSHLGSAVERSAPRLDGLQTSVPEGQTPVQPDVARWTGVVEQRPEGGMACGGPRIRVE